MQAFIDYFDRHPNGAIQIFVNTHSIWKLPTDGRHSSWGLGWAHNLPVSCVAVLPGDGDTMFTLYDLVFNLTKQYGIGSDNVNIGNL